ncbi:hypothetical protein [Tannerella forsythia]|nr:hypothetical protein [Tannerella forsythia]
MKKKKTNRVSKLMLAVCLLTASSGGIAWGQSNLGGAGSVQNIGSMLI